MSIPSISDQPRVWEVLHKHLLSLTMIWMWKEVGGGRDEGES